MPAHATVIRLLAKPLPPVPTRTAGTGASCVLPCQITFAIISVPAAFAVTAASAGCCGAGAGIRGRTFYRSLAGCRCAEHGKLFFDFRRIALFALHRCAGPGYEFFKCVSAFLTDVFVYRHKKILFDPVENFYLTIHPPVQFVKFNRLSGLSSGNIHRCKHCFC